MASNPKIQTLQTTQTTNAATYALDVAHSEALFSVRHMMFANVTGRIPITGGLVRTDERGEPTHVEAELALAGIDTGSKDRDAHLRSGDFFDVENHPRMAFVSRAIERIDDDAYRIVGDLTIRGATQEVVLDVERLGEGKDPWGNHKVGIAAKTTLERTRWGLNWNAALEAGGVLVGDKVKVTLNLQLVRSA
jgi:polyisoprenoid-binding protein YceI